MGLPYFFDPGQAFCIFIVVRFNRILDLSSILKKSGYKRLIVVLHFKMS